MLYKRKWIGWLMFLPAGAFLIAFLIVPFITNVIQSFQNIEALSLTSGPWVGFQNYIDFFQKPNMGSLSATKYFWTALGNTGILIAFTILVEVGFALILAILVDRVRVGKTFFRVTFFLPIVISATAIATMFLFMYSDSTGVMEKIFGNGFQAITAKHTFRSLLFVIFPIVWQYVGFYFVILLTGIAGISEDINEAATIDGANVWQKVFLITLPMLWNVLRTCMVLAITGALKVYDMPAIIVQNGGPRGQLYFLGTYMQQAFRSDFVSYRATLAVVIVILGVILSTVSNLVLRENKDI